LTLLGWGILVFVGLQRLAELLYANYNTKALLARGAVEIGRKHYPLIVLLHASWLAAIAVSLSPKPPVNFIWLGIFILLQSLRLWILATLGPYWTTRIIMLPGAPLVRKGPYRFLRHPNYCVVAAEIFVLPMIFGQWQLALIFTVLNAVMLAWRIRVEETALSVRRDLAA
jgi:methyltransferase